MTTTYSIAEARDQFATLVRKVESKNKPIRVTRRGEPVAVILSVDEYERWLAYQPERDFWRAYLQYRERWQDIPKSNLQQMNVRLPTTVMVPSRYKYESTSVGSVLKEVAAKLFKN